MYQLGQTLTWGRNDRGIAGKELVLVDAISEDACPSCGFDGEWNAVIILKKDTISSCTLNRGEINFALVGDSYYVLQDGNLL